MISARFDEVEAVKLLLDAGADPGIRDKRGRTALDHAYETSSGAISLLESVGPYMEESRSIG